MRPTRPLPHISEVPDDFVVCSDCDKTYHPSGSWECGCGQCETCAGKVAPDGICLSCAKRCLGCEELYEPKRLTGDGWCTPCLLDLSVEEKREANPPRCGHGDDCSGWSAIAGECAVILRARKAAGHFVSPGLR